MNTSAAPKDCEAGGGPQLSLIPVSWRGFYLEALTRAELGRGRNADAAQAAHNAGVMASGLGLANQTAWAQRAHAVVGLPRATRARPPSSHSRQQTARTPPVLASSRGALARSPVARRLGLGERDRGVVESQTAAALFDCCGATRLREEVERDLRRLGRPYRRRRLDGDAGAAALTPRELEIAELVSARMTNRGIAGELFLSEKTVEAHLRNIFGKLGISSRRAIADCLP